MRRYQPVLALILLTLAGCGETAGEVVRFQPNALQELVSNPGQPIRVVSRGQQSVVSVQPYRQPFAKRPDFLVTIRNVTGQPLRFAMSGVKIVQIVADKQTTLKVYSRDELIQEDNITSIGTSILAGARAGAADARSEDEDPTNGDAIMQQYRERRQQVLHELYELSLRSYTLAPQETYSGRLVIETPLANSAGLRTYAIIITIGSDQHEILAAQSRSPG